MLNIQALLHFLMIPCLFAASLFLCLATPGVSAPSSQAENSISANQKALQTIVLEPVQDVKKQCHDLMSLQNPRLESLNVLFKPYRLPLLYCFKKSVNEPLRPEQRFLFFWTPSEPGGNSHGEGWELRLRSDDALQLNLRQYPFLTCEHFQAHRYCGWDLRIQRRSGLLIITANNIAQPCQIKQSWQAIFDEIATEFKNCQQPIRF